MSQPQPAPALVLRAFYLQPGVTFVPGCMGFSSLSHWERRKHGEQLKVEEQKNGDIWITNPRDERIEISVLAIAYKVRGPEQLKQGEAVRRGA